MDNPEPESEEIVWARDGVVTYRCPKSLITLQSAHLFQQFQIWEELGGGSCWDLPAKAADAFRILKFAQQKEEKREQEQQSQ